MAGKRIVVLGATGFIGPAVLRRVIERGHHAIAVSRAGGEGGVRGAEGLAADRANPNDMASALQAIRPDAVIDLIAYTAADTLPLIHGMSGRVGRYVLASSGDVYQQYDVLHRRAAGLPQAWLSEAAPLRTRPFPYRTGSRRPATAPDAWMDDYDKIPIEQGLAETPDLSWAVLRLPMVYGPGDRNRRFNWAVGPMLRAAGSLLIDSQWAAWRTSLGYVDDVADALVLAALHPDADGLTFNVGPTSVKTNLEWAADLAEVCGWCGKFDIVPRDRLPESARSGLTALDLTTPLCLDTSLIRQRLGYVEVVAPADALSATVDAERLRSAS